MSVSAPSRLKIRSLINGCAVESDFVGIVWCIFKHGAEYFQCLCIPFPVAEGLTRMATPAVSSLYNLGWDLDRRVVRRVTLRDLLFIKGWTTAVQFGFGLFLRGWSSYTSCLWTHFKAPKATLILPTIISALDAVALSLRTTFNYSCWSMHGGLPVAFTLSRVNLKLASNVALLWSLF
jgi:hypothetical protein